MSYKSVHLWSTALISMAAPLSKLRPGSDPMVVPRRSAPQWHPSIPIGLQVFGQKPRLGASLRLLVWMSVASWIVQELVWTSQHRLRVVSSISTARKGTILAGCIVGGLAICLMLILVFFSTRTTNVFVENDTSEQATVATCGSDPATVNPGQSANLYPPSTPTSALCIVYRGETREYIGCLSIAKSEFFNGSVVKLSKMNAEVPMSKCVSKR
jgi:hypothetical protein